MRVIQYTVAADRAAENETLVRAVFAELAETAPAEMRYATLRLDDGVTFVHIYDGDADALRAVGAFKAFRAELQDRCVAPPAFSDAEVVGAFGWQA
jgi:hypothetical protein